MKALHFFNHSEIKTVGEYAVKRNDGSCYPEMGTERIYRFPNGYGASVIRHENSYGGRSSTGSQGVQSLYELAVLDSNDEICYDTPVTSNVIGWLTISEVDSLLEDISRLENRVSTVTLHRVPTPEDLFG